MKNIIQRGRSAIILYAILIPFFLLTFFGQRSGRIIGLGFFIVFSNWALYEVIKHNRLPIWANLILLLTSNIIWIFPTQFYLTSAQNPNIFWDTDKVSLTTDNLLKTIYKDGFLGSNSRFASIEFYVLGIVNIAFFFIFFKSQKNKKFFSSAMSITAFATFIIPIFLKVLFILNAANIYLLFCVFIIPMVTDTAAYFGGKFLGHKLFKRKFAPKISPKKTWEGAIIGYLCGALFVFIVMYIGKLTNNFQLTFYFNYKQIITAVILLPILSTVGDLVFSAIKRTLEIKDFSNLIPGHGGLMDRFDSVSFVTIGATIILLIN
ncbi:phosphatidate cytidylyltransferase [Mycoplasma struthionis]|uniref:Phosphatidate cytidylyltransferase n=1 Tax=Mycoplasma struthionis TaxID=538220 RepID=A0A502M473_9MOLU|nr:CDP-archaeol synthase [Mycoplasma struthionis]TPI02455.1 CDP-archaeol synthase [Mycoplasma struthionis]